MYQVNIKPLTVNRAWRGRRFRSDQYKAYTQEMLLKLPPKLDIPEGELVIIFKFYFSAASSDYDNPIKPTQDLICQKYGINDNRIKAGFAEKFKVKKGEDRLEFNIINRDQLTVSY